MTGTSTRRTVKEVTALIERGPLHSTLYYWLLEHHDELLAAAQAGPIRWAPLCAKFVSLGLSNKHGSIASPATARQTWLRVRLAVRRDRLLRTTGVAFPHAKAGVRSSGPGVQAVQPRSHSIAMHSSPNPEAAVIGDTRPGVSGPVSRQVSLARLAEIRQTLNARSGR